MNRMLSAGLLLGLTVLLPGAGLPTPSSRTPTATVLICESKSAYAYHAYECSGLRRCRHTISKVSLADAKNAGYKPCKICH